MAELTSKRALELLIERTQELAEQLRRAMREYPRAEAVRHPFHSAFRPKPGERPKRSQWLLMKWRNQLEARNNVLRDHFILQDRANVLNRYPLAGYGSLPNFGYGLTAADCTAAFERELLLLSGEIEARRSETEAPFAKETGAPGHGQAQMVGGGDGAGPRKSTEETDVLGRDEGPLLTAREVAERLGLPLQRVYELARKDCLPVIRFGRQVRFDPGVIDTFLAKGGKQ